MGGGADEDVGRGDRHRWQNGPALLPEEGGEEPIHVVRPSPRASAWCSGRPGSATSPTRSSPFPPCRAAGHRGRGGDHRRHGLPARIAQNIIDKKADYILALKGNQGTLRDDVELFAGEQKAVAFKNSSVSQDTTVDGDHGRIETRTITVFHDIGWLQDNHQWPGLKSVVMVESERETDGKVETETRIYITSLALLANP